MKLYAPIACFFLFWLLLCSGRLQAQVVTTDPAFPTADKAVTITFDLKQAKDSRAKGLFGKTGDVYLWSGAGTSEDANAFEYQPAGQTNWGAPFEPGRMTPLGNDRWQITLVPRQYFGVPAGAPIRKLGLLLKNGNGTAQTEDIIIPVYETAFQVAFQQPEREFFFAAPNSTIQVEVKASEAADLRLLHDGVEVRRAKGTDKLSYTLRTGADRGLRHRLVVEAKTETENATDVLEYMIRPTSPVAALPAGMQDGINYVEDEEVVLVLYAPRKQYVYAVGEFNDWQPRQEHLMNRTPDGERYWLRLTGLPAGQEVAYQYLVDGDLAVADPYAEKILDPEHDRFLTAANYPNLKPYPEGATGIVSVLQTQRPKYKWQVPDFERPAVEQLVVYELLLRDFVATRNYKTLADTLGYFKRLGINAIQLMPVMEFTGNESWGYNPTFFFAPDKAYGTADDLKAFIDAAHQAGIAVILDIVLNQADYEFPYVKLYWDGDKPSADNPYFNPQATHPYSVFFDFNHDSPATQALVQRVTEFWLQEYNVDGFRFDLSKGFTQKQTGDNVDAWSAYDADRVATWKRIYDDIRRIDETAYVILEHFADNTEEKELANYGMLFWGNANHDFRQLGKGQNANPQWLSHKVRGWEQPHVIGYLESHDEERLVYDVKQNGKSTSSYSTRNLPTALNRAKLAAAFALTVPGPKMLWQFGELGYDVSIEENGRTGNKPIRWEYQNDPERAKLYQVYAELIKLKTSQPAFATEDFSLDLANIVKRITLRSEEMSVFLIGNFDVQQQTAPSGFPQAGTWYDYFSGEELLVTDPQREVLLEPGEFRLFTTQQLDQPKPNLLPWGRIILSADELLVAGTSIKVFPNPTPGAVNLYLESDYRGQVQLQVLDVTGRVVYRESLAKTQEVWQQPLPLHTMPGGLYFLHLRAGDTYQVQKLVKVTE
ncbi:putative secreted protein (Por secretion system target) [Pontibacter mucosus]|uniref:Putative secreted protein (Por secretion system target) n=1 Tax=Pontibacter mucosus TaxID=1649266 RepID=A0A2T5YGJ3_9BACT|nr:putative secreted protein (Por secretion system target) [Pontibacter mucosus]